MKLLRLAVVFALVAAGAAYLGNGGFTAEVADLARILFFVFAAITFVLVFVGIFMFEDLR